MKTSTIHRAPQGVRPVLPIKQQYQQVDPAFLASFFGLTGSNLQYATEYTVGGLPAIGRGVEMVANAVATMLTSADVVSPAGDVVATPNIVKRPGGYLIGSFSYWKMVVRSMMLRGNFIGILADYDVTGYPRQVIPVHPDQVALDLSTGYPIYQVGEEYYTFDQVVHISNNAPTGGLWGCGIIEHYRTTLEGHLYQNAYGTNSFKNGAVPSAVIELAVDKVTEEEASAVQDRWIEQHGMGERKPAVLPKTMHVTPLSFSPHDAEYIESKKLSVAESAHICGLRPEDLGASIGGSALSYANRTDDGIQRIQDSYNPWMQLIEQAWSDLVPGGNYVRGNVEALLRTSTKDRFDVYKVGKELGIYTTEELRELEKRPALPASAPVEPVVAPEVASATTEEAAQ